MAAGNWWRALSVQQSVIEQRPAGRRQGLRALAVAAFVFLVAACGSGTEDTEISAPAEPVLIGEFETLTGETINLEQLQGQDVVLWFWAPW